MLDKQLEQALNDQINYEFYSSYLYLGMAAQLVEINLDGAANWMRVQAQEEITHAMKIYDYIIDREGTVVLEDVKAGNGKYASLEEAFAKTLAHEKNVTSRFNDLINLALEKKDHVTNSFLQWFISEQIEEEASAKMILDKAKMLSGSLENIYILDKELGTRVFNPPTSSK